MAMFDGGDGTSQCGGSGHCRRRRSQADRCQTVGQLMSRCSTECPAGGTAREQEPTDRMQVDSCAAAHLSAPVTKPRSARDRQDKKLDYVPVPSGVLPMTLGCALADFADVASCCLACAGEATFSATSEMAPVCLPRWRSPLPDSGCPADWSSAAKDDDDMV